jgi:hypothetical protein
MRKARGGAWNLLSYSRAHCNSGIIRLLTNFLLQQMVAREIEMSEDGARENNRTGRSLRAAAA